MSWRGWTILAGILWFIALVALLTVLPILA